MMTRQKKSKIDESEVEISFVASQGAGGQNVNKVATTAHLRFAIADSSLPVEIKQRLLKRSDQRITTDGTIVIKAQSHRTREQNRQSALHRLQEMVDQAAAIPRKRKPTKPTAGSKQRRLDNKTKRGQTKSLRSKIKV
ncbi:MAG: aminoacyl-tRNA hydrolase [Desulfuromonas sp.]|nr:MAG: aminoacyl-tRNA hydrolase [Desulfuromonas sp.]